VGKYKLFVKPSAAKEIETVGAKQDRQRILGKIRGMATEPRPSGVEKLAGFNYRYRLRQGSYGVVYLIDDTNMEVTIYKVGHRKDVYR
jgi:mRNA interferase RelE/StbE